METIGMSPKVAVPALVGVVAGVALVALGQEQVGLGVLGSALASFGIGYTAPPGIVVAPEPTVDVASDELLGDPSPPAR